MAKTSKKNKVKVESEGQAHIQATFNNIIISITNNSGQVISWSSAGKMGFRGSKKNTPYAAQLAAEDCTKVALEAGLKRVKVFVKGPGSGRESAIRTIHNNGVLVTEMEHHSNLVPWQMISEKTSSSLEYISLQKNGMLDLSSIETDLNEIGMLAMVHQSNVFGTINPVSKIIELAKSRGIVTLIDGAQAIPHFPVDISKIDCDFYVYSGHKMVGPTGVGVLVGRKTILEKMDPFLGGGEMINNVTMEKSTWNEIPWKFEAGTPNIAQVIGLGRAIEFICDIGLENIQLHEDKLLEYSIEELSKINGIELYGNPSNRGAVIPFNIEGVHSHDLAKFLDTDEICIRAGHHCAQPIMNVLGISASARASFYLYNNAKDIDKLVESIKKTAKILA